MRISRLLKKSVVGVTVAASLSAIGTVVAVSSAMAASTMVATGNVNLRTGPGTSYDVITVIPQGARVQATGTVSAGWIEVDFNGRRGYASGTYLAAAGAETPTTAEAAGSAVTTANVNVRTGPGTSYSIVGYAPLGTTVSTTGQTSGNWTQVLWSGTARWISSSYLRTATSGASGETAETPAVVGQVRTTANVNLRTEGHSSAPIYGVLPANSVVDITGKTTASYTQIVYEGRALWIYTAYTTSTDAQPLVATSPNERLQKVLDYARAQVGDRYVWGAEGPDAFDCSGLTMMAYRQAGISLPHYSGYQATMGTAVSRANMQPGDLIFWYTPVAHVSMYVGNGKMIHARGTAYGVVEQSVDQYASWTPIVGIRRFINS
nr:SH3 domain-containing protein [Propionibacterium sp.]